VHGKDAAMRSIAVSEALYGERELGTLSAEERTMILAEAPSLRLTHAELTTGYSVMDALVNSELAPSKGEARRLIEGKGVALNDVKVEAVDALILPEHFQNGLALLKRGKQLLVLSLS
jgi:tyrosyl-tRNA synthetase